MNNVGTLNRFIFPERIGHYEKAHYVAGEWLNPETYGAAQDSLCHILVALHIQFQHMVVDEITSYLQVDRDLEETFGVWDKAAARRA